MMRFQTRAVAISIALTSTLALGTLVTACGDSKPAKSASCPAGTVQKGDDCLPGGDSTAEDSTTKTTKGDESATKSEEGDSTATAEDAPKPKKHKAEASDDSSAGGGSSGGGSSYDKEAVKVVLNRAVRQVAANCGSTKDENGNSGPWGKTKITVTLARSGHTRGITLASDFEDKPAGRCITQAFNKIVFPPYNAGSDDTIDVDLDVKKPSGK